MEMDLASLQSVREFAEQYKGPIACILVRCFIFLVAVQQLDAVQVKVSQTNGMNNWNWTSDLCFKWCVLSCFNQHWKKGPQSSPQIGSDLKEKSELSGCACAQRCYSGHWRPDPNRGPWIFFPAKFEFNLSRFLKLQTFLEFSPRCIWGMISSLTSYIFQPPCFARTASKSAYRHGGLTKTIQNQPINFLAWFIHGSCMIWPFHAVPFFFGVQVNYLSTLEPETSKM